MSTDLDSKLLTDFRRHLCVFVLDAARGAARGEDVERMNRELRKRWAERIERATVEACDAARARALGPDGQGHVCADSE